ncbi:hypothetical protein [Petrimonas sulfuriphila]|uniref:hypothetical protein n=1 Tax=Petrimonas sulfuriphila TaxID=285070 RepID=UPI003EB8887E
MRQKCDTNIKLAQELINNKYYTNSVHCSYYACLQFIKYILDKKNVCSFQKQNEKKDNSHLFILNKLINEIRSPKTLRYVRTNFNSLKDKRVRADYHEDVFEADESLTAIDEAKGIIYQVRTAFGEH